MNTVQEINLAVPNLTAVARSAVLNRGIGHDTAAADGPFYGAFAVPLAAVVGEVHDKVLADLTPSTFDGHVPVALVWTAAQKDESGEPYCLATRISFVPSGDATIGSQEVRAVAVIGSDSTTLLGAMDLLEPITVNFIGPVRLYVDMSLSLVPAENPQ